MSAQAQTAPNTRAGTSNSSTSETLQEESSVPSRQEIAAFIDLIEDAKLQAKPGEVPAVEAPRKMILHYTKSAGLRGSDTGYFVFQGVKVFEKGKRAEAEARDRLTTEDKLHGPTGKFPIVYRTANGAIEDASLRGSSDEYVERIERVFIRKVK